MKKLFITLLLAIFVFVSTPNFAEASPKKHREHHARTYRNSEGKRVRSPVHTNTAPAGASAECRDGSYSFSQNRRGTCSHHGGVKRWL
jgi:hypothetical protein